MVDEGEEGSRGAGDEEEGVGGGEERVGGGEADAWWGVSCGVWIRLVWEERLWMWGWGVVTKAHICAYVGCPWKPSIAG